MAKLDMLFSYWSQNFEKEKSALAYMLHDTVDEGNLSYNEIKGHDLQVVGHLRQAVEKHDFCVCLASLERAIHNDDDDDDDDDSDFKREIDQSTDVTTVSCVVELDEAEVANGMEVEEFEDMLIQADAFENVKPGNKTSDGYVYHRTVFSYSPHADFSTDIDIRWCSSCRGGIESHTS